MSLKFSSDQITQTTDLVLRHNMFGDTIVFFLLLVISECAKKQMS